MQGTGDPAEFLDGFVHEETQCQDDSTDLMVGAVYRIEEPGRIDFGVRPSHVRRLS